MKSNAIQKVTGSFWTWFVQAPHRGFKGVCSMLSMKFFMAVILYLGAFLVFAKDSFFLQEGVFVYAQGMVTLFLAFVIGAAINWELCLFGKPLGANLLLHIIQMFPLSLFIARITSMPSVPPEPESLAGKAWVAVRHGFDDVFGNIFRFLPDWLTDMFSNWRISLVLILVLFILCLRNLRLKIASLACVMIVALFSIVQMGENVGQVLLGMVLLGAGMSLQFCRYDRVVYYENVLKRLQKSESLDSMFTAVVLRTMTQLQERGRISEKAFLQVVSDEYHEENYSTRDIQDFCRIVLQKMIFGYNLIQIQSDSQGVYLEADRSLGYYDGMLKCISQVPRLVLLAFVAIIWILLPIDVIPDAVPFIGMLDDVAVTVLTGMAFWNTRNDTRK